MFKIPEKQIIVNSDDQVRLLDDDGTAYVNGDVSAAGSGFIIEGFLGPVLVSQIPNQTVYQNGALNTVKINKEAAVQPTTHQITYQVTSTSANAGDVFRLVFKSIDFAEVEYQNWPVTKMYQVSGTLSSAILIATAMEAAINADKDSMVTVSRNSATLTLTAKDPSKTFKLFVDPILSLIRGTTTVVTEATLGVHTYDYLKNIEWSKNLDFDRNQQWQPLKGVSYTMYNFKVNSTNFLPEGNNTPNAAGGTSTTEFKLWVSAAASTFKAAMDLLVGDINPLT